MVISIEVSPVVYRFDHILKYFYKFNVNFITFKFFRLKLTLPTKCVTLGHHTGSPTLARFDSKLIVATPPVCQLVFLSTS